MAAKASVKVKDRASIAKLKKAFGKAKLEVGIMGAKGAALNKKLTVAQIAFNHENGRGVPKRPWLSGWATAETVMIKQDLRKAAEIVVRKQVEPKKVLNAVGLKFVGSIVNRLTNQNALLPLAPSTIAKKKSSRPLIDTGRMWKSITHRVK